MYNNIFAASYKAYGRSSSDPRSGAVAVVFIHQYITLFLIIAIIKKIFVLDFTALRDYRYLALLVFLVLWALLNKYFSNKIRVQEIIIDFENKSKNLRKLWGWVTVLSFIIEVTAMAFLLRK